MIIIEVNIVDAIMGAGKTTAMINYINNLDRNVKILYITPFLTEVERIIASCPDKHFYQPKDNVKNSKLEGIKYLFRHGKNVVSTHALFHYFDQETVDLAYNNNYILIMDEVADVVDDLDITQKDLDVILEKFADINDKHLLKWKDSDYIGKYEDYKRLADIDCIGVYNKTATVWLFPISTFRAFRKIYILTYLFQAQTQKYYYDYFGIKYNYLYVKGNSPDTYQLTDEPQAYQYKNYKKLIHILDNQRINQIGDLDGSLSKSWYNRNSNNGLLVILKNNCINFFTHITHTKSQYNIWTTFKKFQNDVSGKGYSKGFLPSNIRATNNYRDRISVAYLINKFFNPIIKNFFIENDVQVDEDAFAVSEMLQWIWRSAIRDNKEITLYIPSLRMRNLLIKWIEQNSNDSG